MAVDSNVLIFERIREELELGKTVRNAVDLGFQRALSAIIDSNVTTIIAALFLFQFGTGPIKGSRSPLTLGLLISMFHRDLRLAGDLRPAAVTPRARDDAVGLGGASHVQDPAQHQLRVHEVPPFLDHPVDGDQHRGALPHLRRPGFKYGVDFAGGTQVTVKFKSTPDLGRIRKALEDLKLAP